MNRSIPSPLALEGGSSSLPVAPPVDSEEAALDPTASRSQGVVRVFLRHVPEQLLGISNALESGDPEALRAAAHKLKGSCLSVGVPRMAALSAGLESLPTDGIDLKAQQDREFERVREQLTQLPPLKSA